MYYVAVLFFHVFVFFHWLIWLQISICQPRISREQEFYVANQWLPWSGIGG